jgi:hypothetical protein
MTIHTGRDMQAMPVDNASGRQVIFKMDADLLVPASADDGS